MEIMKKLPGILLKLSIIMAILTGLSIGTLKLLERQPELLREGIENYLSEITALSARVEQTGHIKFYPSFDMSLSRISFYDISDPDFFPMTIELMEIKMPFLSILLNARNFESVNVQGLKAKPGIIFPKALEVKEAGIIDDGILPPQIHVKGKYDDADLDIHIGLEREKKTAEQSLYKIAKETAFSIKIGKISLDGTFAEKGRQPVFREALLQVGDTTYGPQDLDLSADEDYVSITSCLFEYGANEALVKEHCTGYFNGDDNNKK